MTFVKGTGIIIGLFLLVSACLFVYTWIRFREKIRLHAKSAVRDIPDCWLPTTQYVTNRGGIRIAYWYFPVDNPKALVILIHGYDNPGGKAQMLIHAKYLHDAGYATALIDLRAYGESEGSIMSLGVNEWEDVEALHDALSNKLEIKGRKIGYMGVSMGAAVALVTAGHTGKGDFVIASVPYADIGSLFEPQLRVAGLAPSLFLPFVRSAARIELGSGYEKFAPSSLVARIRVPTLFIGAERDTEVNFEDARRLYNLTPQPKEFWEVDSPHDVYDAFPEEYKKRILRFLRNNV